MSLLETEVKFYLEDPEAVRVRIGSLGAIFKSRTPEENIRFEDRGHSLVRKRALLRLRKTRDRILLTFKGEIPDSDGEFKIFRESEVAVSDFETMIAILEGIGYLPVQRYEKFRETWKLGETELCLDRMPYGDFLEIEGQPEAIKDCAGKLGLKWPDRITDNYLSMFERLKTETRLEFNDVTFDNFKQAPIDFSAFKHLFRAR